MSSPSHRHYKKVAKQLREIEEAEGLWSGLFGDDFRNISVGQRALDEQQVFADRCLVVQQAIELGMHVPKTLLKKYGPDAGIEPNPPVPEDKSEGPPF
ncbi:MAG: hypothetical protein MUE52_02860 [Tabrizicola sp.]|jgi:hypothetical protein|nr:hypothetical protein [Tabrizicola sp.]